MASIYTVNSSDLTNLASAIRSKTGTSASLMYTADFISEIDGLKVGISEKEWVERTFSEYINTTKTGKNLNAQWYTFACMSNLEKIEITNLNIVATQFAFCCPLLSCISLPACTDIREWAFYSCKSLSSVNFPACTVVNAQAFAKCDSLSLASFPVCASIGYAAFMSCYNLLNLYLASTSLCALNYSETFKSTPIDGYTTSTGGVYGSIFVPASLVDSYKSATNWATYADRITAIV